MVKSKRIESIKRISEAAETEKAREFVESNKFRDENKQRLDSLKVYMNEYATRFKNEGASGLTISRLVNHQQFVKVLGETINLQKKEVNRSNEVMEQKKKDWLHSRMKTKVLDKAAQRYKKIEQNNKDRVEQRNNDEMAQNCFKHHTWED